MEVSEHFCTACILSCHDRLFSDVFHKIWEYELMQFLFASNVCSLYLFRCDLTEWCAAVSSHFEMILKFLAI